jgi:hypothetical protein
LILCFYRLLQLGFISINSITYDFSQWFVVFYLILFVSLIYLKRHTISGLLLATSASHTMIAMLFSLSGAEDFTFSFASVHYYAVSGTLFLMTLHFIKKAEDQKGAKLDLQDLQFLSSSQSKSSFVVFALILFASALPPGPLFLVAYSGIQSLIEAGLYWTTLWSLISVSVLGYLLFSSFTNSGSTPEQAKKNVFNLWKQKPGDTISSDFKEVVFVLMCFLALYGVAFLNL